MNHRFGVRLLAALLPAATLLSGAAHAETVVTEDGARDAEAYDYGFELVAAPQEASVDIIRTVAAFGQRRLDITVQVRALEERVRHGVRVRIRTPRDTFTVKAGRRSDSRPTIAVRKGRGGASGCRGLRVRYDGAADSVTLSVPARCIGGPRWVRLGVTAKATPRVDGENPSTVFFLADDAHRDTFREGSVGVGPRIVRG